MPPGMVTSPYGLKEIPHLVLPMTVQDFADSLYPFHEDTCFHRDIFLVPGLKTLSDDFSFVNNLRGEEIEIIGALEELKAERDVENVVMLMPGSHTHGIYIQGDQITGIISNFTGELFYALKQVPSSRRCSPQTAWSWMRRWCARGSKIWSASASTGPSTSATPCGSLNRELLSSVSPMERASSWAGCASLWSTTVSTSGRSAGRWPLVSDEFMYRLFSMILEGSRYIDRIIWMPISDGKSYGVSGLKKIVSLKGERHE